MIDLMGSKCLLTMFVNNLTFQNLMFMWNELKNKRSFVVLDKALIAIIYLFHESLQQQETHYKFIERYIELMEYSSFVEIYKEIDIDPQEKKKIVDEFYAGVSSEWNKETKKGLHKLSQITNYSQPEI